MRIVLARPADIVVDVPVDAPPVVGLWSSGVRDVVSVQLAVSPAHFALWDVGAAQHSVLAIGRADEGDVVGVFGSVVSAQRRRDVIRPRRRQT